MTRADLRMPDVPEMPAPPIVAWPRLRRVLDRALRTPREGRRIDVGRLVEGWSKGRVFRELPRRSDPTTARLAIVLDGSRRLVPVWGDQLALVATLMRREGNRRVRFVPPPKAGDRRARLPRTQDDEIVFALSDLGAYGDEATRRAWQRFGRRLGKQGVDLRSLSSARAGTHRAAERIWQPIDWQDPRPPSARAPRKVSPRAGKIETLLAAMSPAVRVEPGLLRSLRGVLRRHGHPFGLDAEIEVWRHPHVDGSASRACALRVEHVAAWQNRFAGLTTELKDEIARVILERHQHLPPDIRCLEVLQLRAAGIGEDVLGADEVARAIEIFERASESYASSDAFAGDIEPWAQRLLRRAPPTAVGTPEFRKPLVRLGRTLAERGKLQSPGVTAEMLADPDSEAPIRRLEIRQVGDRLQFSEIPPPSLEALKAENAGPGSPLGEILVRERLFVGDGATVQVEVDLAHEEPSVTALEPTGLLLLSSDVETVTFESICKPSWATAAGRDRHGLWAAFTVGQVEHRMRWIPPGRFLMGSPDDEPGRWSDEGPQHQVVLSEGFWLGATPCTQDLWRQIMGKNPSRFRSDKRPVVDISWEQVHEFCGKLEEEVPGFESSLPTEAQWEYACRAGTSTPTYADPLEIDGQRNAPALHPIAWYGGNSGYEFDLTEGWESSEWEERQFEFPIAGSRVVASKEPNTWGLYDSLGNVLEWCSDAWVEHHEDRCEVDPSTPGGKGSLRVVRGGSWSDVARSVRAAFRHWYRPMTRSPFLGFRLALACKRRAPGPAEPAGRAEHGSDDGTESA